MDAENVADMLTKVLPSEKFKYCLKLLSAKDVWFIRHEVQSLRIEVLVVFQFKELLFEIVKRVRILMMFTATLFKFFIHKVEICKFLGFDWRTLKSQVFKDHLANCYENVLLFRLLKECMLQGRHMITYLFGLLAPVSFFRVYYIFRISISRICNYFQLELVTSKIERTVTIRRLSVDIACGEWVPK